LRDPRPPPLGALMVLAAGLFELLMTVGDVATGAGLGIPILLASTAYAIDGRRLLRPLALPFGFLVLAVPPPGFVMNELLTNLKVLVTGFAVRLLQATGEPVFVDGNRIDVPGHSLFVADACSGLTSIVTLLPVACVIAYFGANGVWRRALIVVSVIPLAMGANVLRVFGTVKLVSWIGIDAAQGALHESFGYLTFVLGTLAVGLVTRLVR
jgi:exosortase